MNYGNSNDIIQTCSRCGESLDRHGFSLIRSDDRTEKLARKLQGALDTVVKHGKLLGTDDARTTCMVGAAVAKIGSAEHVFVTISGADIGILNHISGSVLGSGVTLIKERLALPLTTIKGAPLVLVQPAPWGRNRDYLLGACAAQKLLMAIFKKQKETGGKITSINLAEILWSEPSLGGHNRDWSTGDMVCSCDTCKRVVPIMLCDQAD